MIQLPEKIFKMVKIKKTKMLRTLLKILICTTILVQIKYFYSSDPAHIENVVLRSEVTFKPMVRAIKDDLHSTPVLVIVACQRKEKEKSERNSGMDIHRQLEQTIVLIKSAAFLANSVVRIIVMVDKSSFFEELTQTISSWPEQIRRKLELSMRAIWYPRNRGSIQNAFRVCSTERLFLASALPEIDSAIYLDTDTFFMRPPRELWTQFAHFDSKQFSALTSVVPKKTDSDPGHKLNSGVWLMNLTRMREFPGGWDDKCLSVYKERQGSPGFGMVDQEIANIMFDENPEYFYELECHWNYRRVFCSGQNQNICPAAATKGAFLLHGNTIAFYRERRFQILFEAWRDFDLNRSINDLAMYMQRLLEEADQEGDDSKCGTFKGINTVLTKGLVSSLEN